VRALAVVPVLRQLQLWLLAIGTHRARAAAEDSPVCCPQGYLAAAPPLVRWARLPAAPLQQLLGDTVHLNGVRLIRLSSLRHAPVSSAPDETPDPLSWGRISCSPGEYRSKHPIKTLRSKRVCNTSPDVLPRLSAS
jgi:hypothetical protein